ncbi:hypothetical protein ABZP36_000231 [Zizania latifolia]
MKKESPTSWSVLPARSAAAEPWAADRSKLMIGKRFATGSDSRVYRGIYGRQAVAVKMMRAPEGDDDRRRALEEQFNAEVTLLWRLRHPNVVQFVAACREPPVYCVITEYMSRGTLRAYLHGREPYSLPPETVDMSPVQAAYAVCVGNARPPLSPACPPAINSLIERCWSAKPAKRPEFSHIVSILESYDRCLRQGLPLLPQPSPSPSPLASFLSGFKLRPFKNTMLLSMSDRRIKA